MYVNNGKISSRQTFRLYLFDLMGIATLLLPPILANVCGVDAVWSILLGHGIGIGYMCYLGFVMKRMKTDATTYLIQNMPKWVQKLTFLFVMLHSIVTAGFCAYIFANLMQYTLVKESIYWVVLLVLVLGAAYAVSGGLESRARVYEVLFWIILIPYVAMMLATIKDVELVYLKDFFSSSGEQIIEGAYLVFLLLTPLFFSLFLIGEKEKNYGRNIVKTVSVAIIGSGILLLGSYLLLIGNFGSAALTKMRFPVVTIMSTVQFKGNFLKRMDALMLAVWFFTLYALLNLHLHYGVNMLKELVRKDRKETDVAKQVEKARVWQIVIPSALVFGIGLFLQYFSNGVSWFFQYYNYVAVPFLMFSPIVLLVFGKMKQKRR